MLFCETQACGDAFWSKTTIVFAGSDSPESMKIKLTKESKSHLHSLSPMCTDLHKQTVHKTTIKYYRRRIEVISKMNSSV